MNLEKLLAANMIRFNTKNLNERQVLKILKEQYGAPGRAANANPMVQAFITTRANWGPNFAKLVDTITSLLNKFGVTFTVTTVAEAAAWIALFKSMSSAGFGKTLKDINKFKTAVDFEAEGTGQISNFAQKMIQFNESPDEKGKVLTVGTITAGGQSGNDPGNASAFNEIISYVNNFNIAKIANLDFSLSAGDVRPENFLIKPFVGNTAGTIDSESSFTPGKPGKDPGAGSLDLGKAYDSDTYGYLYAPQKYTAASAVSTGGQTTDITWTPGPETAAKLPEGLFKVYEIKLDPTLAPQLVTAIEDAKKIGQITGLRIESAASFDEEVGLDNAKFAARVGMQPNQVPADPTKDAEGIVTDPMSGGNAFLAYMRGKAIQAAIGNTAGVAPTMQAIVKKGGAAARYSKLFFSIKLADGSTTTTKDNLATIGAKTNVEQLGGQFKVIRLDL